MVLMRKDSRAKALGYNLPSPGGEGLKEGEYVIFTPT
jgi:hypothetical protein